MMETIQRRLPISLIAAGLWCVAANAQVPGGHDVTLKKADGAKVVIPASGPRFNEGAHQAAVDLEALDRDVKNARKQAGNREVIAAMRQIAIDARNDAVDSLDLAYRVSEETSGVLDSEQVDSAKRNVQFAKDILKATPPPR